MDRAWSRGVGWRRTGIGLVFALGCVPLWAALEAKTAARPSPTPTPSPMRAAARATASPAAPAKPPGTVTPAPDNGFTVLCYHRFVPTPIAGSGILSRYCMPVTEFAWEMKYLKDHGITPISVEQLKAYWFDGKPLPAKAVLLTFDDGFKSIYEIAYPVVKRYHYPAVLFAYTDFVGWQKGGDSKGALRYDQLQEMVRNGWTVESHTKSHPHMGKQQENYSPEDYGKFLAEELSAPLTFIQDHFHYASTVLAYPYGDYNETIAAKTRELGYQLAFGVCPGPNDRTVHPMKLHRNLILYPVKHPSFQEIFNVHVLHMVDVFPGDGQLIDDHKPSVSVRILDPVVPSSVDMGIDNHPVLYTYDPSTRLLTHRPKDKLTSGGHILSVRGEDAEGHLYAYSWFFRIKHYPKHKAAKEVPPDVE